MLPFVVQVVAGEIKMSNNSSIGESFISLANQLGEVLSRISVIKNYQEQQKRLYESQEAMYLLRKLSDARKELNTKQRLGTITQEDINSYQKIYDEVGKTPIITEYYQAQQDAVQFLRNVNFEISQLIGIDFSSLIRKKSS